MNNINFTRNLIKGKIAEIIFEKMLREAGAFTVIHFGYEYILPEVSRDSTIQKRNNSNETIEAIRTAPDFAVINNKTKNVKLIEVKYQSTFRKSNMLTMAKKMSKSWNPSYIFLATKKGFYFDSISDIINNKGEISELKHKDIPQKLQDKYLKLLIEMEK